ncbi:MAG TPA: radical SAM protein [Methanomicrobia archaeon]|nr:radical SAM protein [Methanomicrobia archaeon]
MYMSDEELKSWLQAHKNEIFANDAVGTGCFSYLPGEIIWAVTKRCNLKCKHCSISEEDPEELSTEQGFALIEDAARLGPVKFGFTGGEPLLREDIFELIEYASSFDMQIVMATNGTLITRAVARKLRKAGLERAAMSVDAIGSTHDDFRGVEGAFKATMRGMKACEAEGVATQFFTTVSRTNYHELPKIIKLADELEQWRVYLIYLVAVGRGKQIADVCLTTAENGQLFEDMITLQKDAKTWLKPICNPQYWAYLTDRGLMERGDGLHFTGCTAGITRFHIFPNGDVTPCAYLPVAAGNVKERSFLEIIEHAEMFKAMRARALKGACASCRYKTICGGCRSRAYALTGDVLGEDPLCPLVGGTRDPSA